MHELEPKLKKRLPFDFVLHELEELSPRVKPMFGCHAIYVGDKIVLILRDRPTETDDNGIWLATTPEHHASLKQDFPSMRSIGVFGPGVTGWQVLPVDSSDFEDSVLKVCGFILRGDPRVGKIPPKKSSKKQRSKKNGKTSPKHRKRV